MAKLSEEVTRTRQPHWAVVEKATGRVVEIVRSGPVEIPHGYTFTRYYELPPTRAPSAKGKGKAKRGGNRGT